MTKIQSLLARDSFLSSWFIWNRIETVDRNLTALSKQGIER